MQLIFLPFVFIFGTIIGSFLNVVILRYNTGMKIAGNLFGTKIGNASPERSMCFSCGKTLAWYELVPVLSFCFQGGKCRGCKTKISWQYPLVEIATGLIFVGIFSKHVQSASDFSGLLPFVLYAVIWSLLIVITVYDVRHKIIPDGLVYVFIALSFVSVLIPSLLPSFFPTLFPDDVLILNHLLAAVLFFVFFGGLWLVSGGRWIGFGDAKLVVGVGLLLGLSRGLSALALAFWIGAIVSMCLLVFSAVVNWLATKKVVQQSGLQGRLSTLTMKSEIPFAPFIILGTLVSFFCDLNIFNAVGSVLSM